MAAIALSIVFLGAEILAAQRGRRGLTFRYPWIVAFAVGLLHGLGFAGALSEIGVPLNEVPLALLMFNVGVETGQLIFVVGVSLVLTGIRRAHVQSAQMFQRAVPYAVGGLAAFWTFERLATAFTVIS